MSTTGGDTQKSGPGEILVVQRVLPQQDNLVRAEMVFKATRNKEGSVCLSLSPLKREYDSKNDFSRLLVFLFIFAILT